MNPSENLKSYIPVGVVSILLFAGVMWSYAEAKNRPGTVVLPGGITYLGPSPTSPAEVPTYVGTKEGHWSERKGTLYPYTFSYPNILNLGVFPNDPFDSVTAFIDGTDANANIFFRVEPCNLPAGGQGGNCGIGYAENWWKQYSWKGVDTVTIFTNKNGLKGYRAAYINDTGESPYDHVFLEVPNRDDLIIWLSGRLFSKEDFDKLVDSVTWHK